MEQGSLRAGRLAAGLVLAAAVLAAATGAAAAGSSDLTGNIWALGSLAGTKPVPGSNPTIRFEHGHAVGSTGCIDYSARYKAGRRSLKIEGPVAVSLKACSPALSAQEGAFLSMLASVKRYSIRKTTLTLRGSHAKKLATFQKVSQDLSGTSWRVLAYNNGKEAVASVLEGTQLTADFKDGHVSGDGGCNHYSATFKATPPGIKVGPASSTRKECGTPDGVMTQETAYLAALESAATYTTDGARLELRTASGATAVELVRR
jgi:heat shock protein HslJ